MRHQVHDTRHLARWIIAATLAPLGAIPGAVLADGGDDETADVQAAWRDEIAHTPTPAVGCFEAEFPSTDWVEVGCVEAPDTPYVPGPGSGSGGGGGGLAGPLHDGAAFVNTLLTDAKGSFPSVTGVTHESDDGVSDVYSLQLNSSPRMVTVRCLHHIGCHVWQQFIYSSGGRAAFMQYWLLGWNNLCPVGWTARDTDCWKNSAAVAVPQVSILNLSKMSLSGSATVNGNDQLTFTGPSHAYSTSGLDSVLALATAWRLAEFDVLGDGGGTQAVFNAGSHLTAKILVHPTAGGTVGCSELAGYTSESNNLTLGPTCTTFNGTNPYVTFTESN
jgi:hypothetical protein